MDPPTIVVLKQAFLEIATRHLAQQLTPSRAWQRKNDLRYSGHGSDAVVSVNGGTGGAGSMERRIPSKVVDDVLVRSNQLLLLHSRRVHTPAAVRHVAEQLDQLYQSASDNLAAVPSHTDSEHLGQGTDYTTLAAISSLPVTWDHRNEADALPLEARRYAEQVAQLQALAQQRAEMEARVRRLRGILSLLEALSSEDANAQSSLVTRDGPVEGELERMRLLLARVGGRVTNLPAPSLTSKAGLNVNNSDMDKAGSITAGPDDITDVEDIGRHRAGSLLKLV